MKQTITLKSFLPFTCCLFLFMANGSYVQAQKRVSVNPIASPSIKNVGWRDLNTANETPFYLEDSGKNKMVTNLGEKELISVLPSSYCVISKFQKNSDASMMTFNLEAKLQQGNTIEFSAATNVYIIVKEKKFYALPSEKMVVMEGKTVKGRISIPFTANLSKIGQATLCVEIGSDIHKFELTGKTDTKVQELAIIPYNPIWTEKPKQETPQDEKKQEKIVAVAVKKAEDVTKDIKTELKEDLSKTIADLRAKDELSENTQVDVNAEVMPEVKKDGTVEYNMKVRYDVQVVSDFVKKLNISRSTEDWPAGKYRLKDSQAALQTAGIIKSTVESKLEEYITPGTEVTVKIIGGTDGAKFKSSVPYDGSFGNINDAECFVNGAFAYVTITPETGISSNEQLAYLRTLDIKNFMENHIGQFRVANTHYEHFAEIAENLGAQYRRVAVEITVHNAFNQKYPEIAAYKENVYERNSEVDKNIPVVQANSNAVAVIIGNTEYQVATGKQGTTKVGPVKYAVNDATTMRDYLTRTLGVNQKNIIFKTNADKKDFDDIFGTNDKEGEIAELVKRTGAKEIYFYYSGHGYPFMGEPYLLGVRSNPKNCKEQATSLQSIYRTLGALPVEKVNVITDACFSGQEISMEASATEFARRPKPDKLAKFVILSAASEEQYANWYKDKKHGLFSYVLFKAMQDKDKSDLNGDGVLTFDELYKYLADSHFYGVPYLVKELEGEQVRQDPVIQVSARAKDTFVKY